MSNPSNHEIVLAIETALSGGSLALRRGSSTFVHAGSVSRSEDLLPAIDSLLRKASLDIGEVTMIAVSIGPGSFTGIRIGIATALGFKASLGAACFGVSTTEAVASTSPEVDRYAVVPAGRGQFSVQYFETGKIEAQSTSQFQVVRENELCQMIMGHSQTTFVFAYEIDLAGFRDSTSPMAMPNAIISEHTTGELMSVLVANGYGRLDLIPIYARPEGSTTR